MKYTDSAVALAQRELEARRERAEDEQRMREAEIAVKIPEIALMRRNLRENYMSLIKLVASHEPNAAELARRVRDRSLEISESIAIMLGSLTGDRHYLDPKYTCPKCRDRGFVEGNRCECMEELLKKYTLEELNSSSSIKLHDFSEFRGEYYPEGEIRGRMVKNRTMLMNYCDDFSSKAPSMLFIGDTGLGKTFLSSCIVKALSEKGIPSAFMSAFDMLRAMEEEQFHRSDDNTTDRLLSAQLLVIDDLGSEPSSGFYETFIYNVINGRLNRGLPTIITTNLTAEGLRKQYHDRIASRILSDYLPVIFRGSDIRRQKASEQRGGAVKPNGNGKPF